MFDTDVFVIGGGPAGIAAGIAARSRGFRVIVADGNRPPIDKACGEGLMPDSIAAASEVGIRLPEAEGYRFRGIRFHGDGCSVASDFPCGYGLGFRRTKLHALLIRQAADAGTEMLWQTPVTGIGPNEVRLIGRSVSTRWIIGADGTGSHVRQWAGLGRFARNSRRFAYRRHFARKPWTDFMEIYWGEGCQVYVTPVGDEVCVVLISRARGPLLADALGRFRELEAYLAGAPISSSERGAITATAVLKSVVRGNIALIGDASGSIDAITGQGLCQAFRQAGALADAMAAGNLSSYGRLHRSMRRWPKFMADLMLSMDRWPAARRRVLRTLSAHPQWFGKLLALHVRA
jgi:flavin-dependent dehydrogenase